jgi:cytochrome c oxidase cbb3-type subunit 2
VHFVAACVAGWLLATGRAEKVPLAALLPLGLAAVAVNQPSGRQLAGWLYPAGVSLYSAALVAWPGWFSGLVTRRAVAWRAAWLFAVAGWFGSANGIGMAQSLSRVPGWFVAAAAAVVVGALMRAKPHRKRAFWVVLGIVGISLLPRLAKPSSSKINGSAEIGGVLLSESALRGRETYISEGCLHCHSRYVRPGSADVLIWGPTRPAAATLGESPVLIGNRRQGPDLSNVGARRSATWLKLHFIDPAGLLPGSAMPSYESLFRDRRGEDLIAYLRESSAAAVPERMKTAAEWRPDTTTPPTARGGELFSRHCAACHGPQGAGNGPLARSFSRLPTNLVRGPFIWTFPGEELESRTARIIKFGIIGMEMPGHETLPDADIRALAQYALHLRQNPPRVTMPQIIQPPISRQPRPRVIPAPPPSR